MMNKRNKILAGLLAVQLALIVLVFWKNGEPQAEVKHLTADLSAARIDRFLITDEEGKTLEIRLRDGEWQVEIGKGVWYRAEKEKVETMIEKIVGLQSSRLVTRTRGSHDRLKVAEQAFRRRVELGSGKDEPFVLYLGTAPNFKSIHVRSKGSDNVYLVKNLSAWEVQAEPDSWWRTSYVDIDPEKLLAVKLRNANGEFSLARANPQGEWTAHGGDQKLNKDKLTNFLDDASQLSVTNIVLPSGQKPSGEPLAVLDLQSSAGRQVELKIWEREDENSDHPVKSSEDSFYAMAGRYAVDDLLKISISDLVEAPPEVNKE